MNKEVMLNEQQRQRVWEALFNANVRAAYFGDIASERHSWQRYLSAGTLLLSSGAVVTVVNRDLAAWAAWIPPTLSLATAALSAVNFTAQLTKIAIEAADLQAKWANLGCDWQILWDDMHADNAEERLWALERRATELSRAGLSLPYSKERMAKWHDHLESLYNTHERVSATD